MKYGMARLSVIPMREEPSDRSEQVSQILFGEHYIVLQEQEKWLLVGMALDGYKGWIDRKQFVEIVESEKLLLDQSNREFVLDKCGELNDGVSEHLVSFGTIIPSITGEWRYRSWYSGTERLLIKPMLGELPRVAKVFLNSPYQWGGRSVFGVDCSGFVQLVYRIFDCYLPRDAKDQEALGKLVMRADSEEADLAYFGNKYTGKVTHVGILLGKELIIHASGKVRVSKLDDIGIYDDDEVTYTHYLLSIKRVF